MGHVTTSTEATAIDWPAGQNGTRRYATPSPLSLDNRGLKAHGYRRNVATRQAFCSVVERHAPAPQGFRQLQGTFEQHGVQTAAPRASTFAGRSSTKKIRPGSAPARSAARR